MPAPKRIKFTVSSEFMTHCTSAAREFGIAEGSFEQHLQEFIERCQVERKEARQVALAAARARRDAKSGRINASPYVLTYRLRAGLEIYWAEVKYDRKGRKTYSRVSTKGAGAPDLRTILAKALPEELEVIRRHENQARAYRAVWAAYARARQQLNGFVDGLAAPP